MSLADRISGPKVRRGGSHGDRSPRPAPYSRPQLEPAPEDGLWKHDKFAEVNDISEGGLSARISSGTAAPPTKLIQQALSATSNGNATKAPVSRSGGFSIKGAGAKESTTLEIRQLVTGTTPEDVKMIFSQCGKITEAKSMPCDETDSVIIRVTFEKSQDMKNAIRQFNGQEADGRTLVVEEVPLSRSTGDTNKGFDLLDNGGSAAGKMYADSIEGGVTLTRPPRINDSDASWSRGGRGGRGRGRGGSGFRGNRRGSNRGGGGSEESMQVDS
ncbi:hypothetical protein FRC02_000547 [Tulasnella sp. 418]|nr:hypothetical protein FRC02_000547 [Tulasnella sp. 418]